MYSHSDIFTQRTEEDEDEWIGRPSIVMFETVAVGHVAWIVRWQCLDKLLWRDVLIKRNCYTKIMSWQQIVDRKSMALKNRGRPG